MSPNTLYSEAKDEMTQGQWDKAVPLLEKLEAKAAGTPLAQQAQLDKAYAHYKSGENQHRHLATTGQFVKIHPASPAMDYAFI
jgi:outer membrane protein assembly factor BamD